MTFKAPRQTYFVTLAALATVSVATYVHHSRVASATGEIIHIICVSLGFFLVPILVAVSFLSWNNLGEETLARFRKALGLASIVLLSTSWLFDMSLLLLKFVHPSAISFLNLDWFALRLSVLCVAALLAVAVQGAARNLLIAASLFLCAALQSEIIL
jgi:hypothetical protein